MKNDVSFKVRNNRILRNSSISQKQNRKAHMLFNAQECVGDARGDEELLLQVVKGPHL